jgi:hypothetical protein
MKVDFLIQGFLKLNFTFIMLFFQRFLTIFHFYQIFVIFETFIILVFYQLQIMC